MLMTEILRTASTTWSPQSDRANIIAAGSMAGNVDEGFSASARLELFSVDITSNESKLIGKTDSVDRFNRLAWGAGTKDMGLIAGAMVDGAIRIWDPEKIIAGEEDSVVATLEKHTSAVRGLEFNPFQSTLLASGGEDSELYIWNLANINAPSPLSPGGKNPHAGQVISQIAWNRIVQHIIASTSYSGVSVVWDLKQKRPIITLSAQQNKYRCSAIAWNPEVATQLVTASDDDRFPTLQVWDLRKAYAPVKELEGHTKGVLALSWCPDDSNLLLSCGKDARTLCWNPNTGEILSELPTASNWVYDVQWSPRMPAIFTTASFEGKISVHSLLDSSPIGGAAAAAASGQQVHLPATAPKWLKRPCGATFGFGGKLLSFHSTKDNTRKLTISQVVSDEDLVERSKALEQTLQTQEFDKFCTEKINATSDEHEKATWTVMKLLFENDAHRKIRNFLGFDDQKIADDIHAKINQTEDAEQTEEASKSESEEAAVTPVDQSPSSGTQSLIRHALMVGNFEAAVQCCLHSGKMDDALILAAMGGRDLWERTRDAYFERKKNPFMKVVSAIVRNQLDDVVAQSKLEEWKETLALLCTYAKNDFARLCGRLAERLESEQNDKESAALCYMCALNLRKVVELWLGDDAQQGAGSTPSSPVAENSGDAGATNGDKTSLVSFIEKVSIFQRAMQAQNSAATPIDGGLSLAVAVKYTTYAACLTSQGLLDIALRYLNAAAEATAANNSTATPELVELRHRVFNAQENPQGQPPAPSFVPIVVGSGRAPQQHQHQQQQQQQQFHQQPQQQPQHQQPQQFVQPQVYGQPMHIPPQPQPQPHYGGVAGPVPTQPPAGVFQPPQPGSVQPPSMYPPTHGGSMHPPMPTPGAATLTPAPAPRQPSFGLPPQPNVAAILQPPTHTGPMPGQPITTGPPPSTATPTVMVPPPTATTPPATTTTPTAAPVRVAPKPATSPAAASPSAAGVQLETVNTSQVPESQQSIVRLLTEAYSRIPASNGAAKATIGKCLVELFTAMNKQAVEGDLAAQLSEFAVALSKGDGTSADAAIVNITANHWKSVKSYIKGLKAMCSACQ